MSMVDEIFEDTKGHMDKLILAYSKELSKVRTSRASLAVLDGIKVDYYGVPTPLNQVASLAVPESRQIVIQPWEPKLTVDIERAIHKSELGLTPTNDGRVVRISFPPLTEERRKDLVKLVKKMAEDFKVSVRQGRREANEMLKDLEKEKEISQDDLRKHQDKVQKIHDEYIEKVDQILERKEKEIMEV